MKLALPIAVPAFAAALALAGCGGSPSTPASASVIAHKLGCAGYQLAGPGMQGTGWSRQDATCSFWSAGKAVEIVTFTSRQNEDQWVGSPGQGVDVSGDLWAVTVGSEAQAARVVALLGGQAH
jgi:hypothetical protein